MLEKQIFKIQNNAPKHQTSSSQTSMITLHTSLNFFFNIKFGRETAVFLWGVLPSVQCGFVQSTTLHFPTKQNEKTPSNKAYLPCICIHLLHTISQVFHFHRDYKVWCIFYLEDNNKYNNIFYLEDPERNSKYM